MNDQKILESLMQGDTSPLLTAKKQQQDRVGEVIKDLPLPDLIRAAVLVAWENNGETSFLYRLLINLSNRKMGLDDKLKEEKILEIIKNFPILPPGDLYTTRTCGRFFDEDAGFVVHTERVFAEFTPLKQALMDGKSGLLYIHEEFLGVESQMKLLSSLENNFNAPIPYVEVSGDLDNWEILQWGIAINLWGFPRCYLLHIAFPGTFPEFSEED